MRVRTHPTGANFATIENSKNPTIAKFAIVQNEGSRLVTRQVEFYSLDVVLSVGYGKVYRRRTFP